MNYKIIGKYIKDLKFNIPNPKAFFLLSKNISSDIGCNYTVVDVLDSAKIESLKNEFAYEEL